MFYKIEIDKIQCSLKSSAFSFLEASLSKEQTNSKKYYFDWVFFCMLSVLLNVWRIGWKIPYENKWWKTRDTVLGSPASPMGASECWVNVVIVCNLKRPSDHLSIPAETESQEGPVTQRQRILLISQNICTYFFPESLSNHVLKTLIQIFLWKKSPS